MAEPVPEAYRIATKHARACLHECIDQRMPWTEIVAVLESMLAIMVTTLAYDSAITNRERFITEIMDAVTEAAHSRSIAAVRKAEAEGR